MSQHNEKTPKRHVKKIVGGVLALLLVPTAAYAAYVLLFGATGSVSTASVDYDITSTAKLSKTTAQTCTATVTDAESFSLNTEGMFPGDNCSVRVTMNANGTQDATMVLQGVEFVSNESIVTAVAGSSPVKCGDPLAGDPLVDNGIDMTVLAKDTAQMGQSYPADAQAGIKLVPQGQYDPSKCLMFAQDGTVNPAG